MVENNCSLEHSRDLDRCEVEKSVVLSGDTEIYLRACRSLVVSNEDVEFKDTADHSPDLVLAVIRSYESIFLKPMLARGSQ